MSRISYSQLSMYNSCPYHWKLRYIDKISVDKSNIFLLFGRAMHKTLQTYLEIMYNDSVKAADNLNLYEVLQEDIICEFNDIKEKEGEAPCTKKELNEFFDDGVTILNWFKKHRGEYFSKKNWELIGCEVPLNVDLQKGVKWVGFIDVVLYNKMLDIIKIIDIKTSTWGWNKYQKKDKNKTSQLLLYKQFYSKQFNHPIDKINIDYFIVKRKLYTQAQFPQKRIQTFKPADGKISMNRVANELHAFLNEAISEDGEYRRREYEKKSNIKSCKYCEFRDTKYCSAGVK